MAAIGTAAARRLSSNVPDCGRSVPAGVWTAFMVTYTARTADSSQGFTVRAVILPTGHAAGTVRELKRRPLGASVVTPEAAEREAIERALHDAGARSG